MNSEVRLNGNNQGTAVVNWNQHQVQFDFGLKNVETSALTDRFITFRVTVPHYQRTVGFGSGYTVSSDRAATRLELYWDSDAEADFLLESEVSTKAQTRREPTTYEGRFKVTSDLFNTDSSFTHKMLLNGLRRKTEIILDGSQRLVIKSDLNLASGFTHVITIQHPQLSKVRMHFTFFLGGSQSFNEVLESTLMLAAVRTFQAYLLSQLMNLVRRILRLASQYGNNYH